MQRYDRSRDSTILNIKYSPAENLAQARYDQVGVVAESQIGEMYAVDGAVVFHAVHPYGVEIIYIGVAVGHQAVVVAAVGSVLCRQIREHS